MVFNVEKEIEDVIPKVTKKHVVKLAKKVIKEDDINEFLTRNAHLSGFEFVDAVLDHFDFDYSVSRKELLNIPSSGRVLIVANHPLGGLDGLLLLRLVSQVRKDVKIVANDFLASLAGLRPLIHKVGIFKQRKLKSNIKSIYSSLENEEAIIIFPSGEVSRAGLTGVKDGKWKKSFLSFALKTESPVVPIYINAKNSKTFYTVSALNKNLSTFLLPGEMFKKKSQTVNLTIGEMVPFETIRENKKAKKDTTKLFRKHIYRLAKKKKPIFETQKPVAHPEKSSYIKKELEQAEVLLEIDKDLKVYLYTYKKDDSVLKEIGRLRELSFRKVGEGVNKIRDTDKYDNFYKHIILWSEKDLEIVGAYRIGISKDILKKRGHEGFYSNTLFEFTKKFDKFLPNSIELGRSFIQPKYWNTKALDYLWMGIGAFVKKNEDIRYLFGPVSISASYSKIMQMMIASFYETYYGSGKIMAVARTPMKKEKVEKNILKEVFSFDDHDKDQKALKTYFKNHGTSIPPLYKHYTTLCEREGVSFLGFNVDRDFADCLDGLVLVDLNYLRPGKKKRYLG